MKNKILLIISLVISTSAFAQLKTTLGARAGIISSGFRGNTVNSLNNLLDFTNGGITTADHAGFFGGIYADVPVANTISIEPGLYYSQKGYDINGALNLKGMDFLGANAKAKLQMQYIDIPVLIKANMGGLQLFAGPQFSYLSKASLRTTAGALGINILNSTMDATSQFNRWDAGITAGIGYQFTNGMNLVASYDYGLSKIDAAKSTSTYNRAIKLGLGISF
ncbi:MAG: porin family protein [Ginsengibacter sp.]